MGIKILTLETSCYWPSLKRLETITFSWTTVLIVPRQQNSVGRPPGPRGRGSSRLAMACTALFERSLDEKAPLGKFMHKFFVFFIRVHEFGFIFIALWLMELPRIPEPNEAFWAGLYPVLFPLVSYRRPGNLDFLNCNEPDDPSIVLRFQTSFFQNINPYPEIWPKIYKNQ